MISFMIFTIQIRRSEYSHCEKKKLFFNLSERIKHSTDLIFIRLFPIANDLNHQYTIKEFLSTNETNNPLTGLSKFTTLLHYFISWALDSQIEQKDHIDFFKFREAQESLFVWGKVNPLTPYRYKKVLLLSNH